MGTESYTIGRGKLLFKPDGYADAGFEDLGNCPDFKITVSTDKKEHISSREGLQTKDLEVVVKQSSTGQFTLDEPNIENIKRFIMSDAGSTTNQTAGNDATPQDFIADLDRWIDLGKKNLTPATTVVKAETPAEWQASHPYVLTDFVEPATPNGFRYECTTAGTSDSSEPAWPTTIGATVNDGTAVWTCRKLTYTADVDYTLDADAGLFKCLGTGAIADDQALKITRYWGAATIQQANAAKATTVKGHVWFVGNPAAGRKLEVKGYASLLPSGDISMIGDDWMSFGFSMEFLTHASYDGLFEVHDRGYIT
jgi:hypothetical protein